MGGDNPCSKHFSGGTQGSDPSIGSYVGYFALRGVFEMLRFSVGFA